MSQVRDRILSNVKSALAARPKPPVQAPGPEPWNEPESRLSLDEMADQFKTRWVAVGGEFYKVPGPEALNGVLAEVLSSSSGQRAALAPSAAALAPGLEDTLRGLGIEPVGPHPESAREAGLGLTGVFTAMAYSGTLMVTSREPGELSASLAPPVHVALIPRDRLVYGPRAAIRRLVEAGLPRGAALITGPSRTADIELTLVMGVHGPGRTAALLLEY